MNCSHGGSNHCSAGHGAGQGHVAPEPGRSKSLELHHQRSTDSDKEVPLVTSARHRVSLMNINCEDCCDVHMS